MVSSVLHPSQQRIIDELRVKPTIDVEHELQRRIGFLCRYLRQARAQALVLGISGGVDSLVAGCLAQRAVEALRQEGHNALFVAMRLPYGEQTDAADAEAGIQVIRPDRTLTVNVKPATDAVLQQLEAAGQQFDSASRKDFIVGNIKARQRMIVQYACAAAENGLVVGSDHAAEALMGFFTKYGDGAADVMPLAGLTKRQVRALGLHMGAPAALVNKVPTADLETLTPMRPDELAFGVSYDEIDDFLEGKAVSEHAATTMLQYFTQSEHKRSMPAHP